MEFVWSCMGTFGSCTVFLPGIVQQRVGIVGESAAGVVTEDPGKFGHFDAGSGNPGYLWAINRLCNHAENRVLGGNLLPLTTHQGLLIFAAAMPIAFVGLLSAIAQGRAAAAGVGIIAKRPEELAKGITYAAMVETYAVLALLASILMLFGIQL